jgi:hypothetical protein
VSFERLSPSALRIKSVGGKDFAGVRPRKTALNPWYSVFSIFSYDDVPRFTWAQAVQPIVVTGPLVYVQEVCCGALRVEVYFV